MKSLPMKIRRMQFFGLWLLPALAGAQQTVAPTTDEPVSAVRGENAGVYNVVQSWELGYRFATGGRG